MYIIIYNYFPWIETLTRQALSQDLDKDKQLVWGTIKLLNLTQPYFLFTTMLPS